MKKIGYIGNVEVNIGWIIPPIIIDRTTTGITVHVVLPFIAFSYEIDRKTKK
jgi:hypothetical protein